MMQAIDKNSSILKVKPRRGVVEKKEKLTSRYILIQIMQIMLLIEYLSLSIVCFLEKAW